MHKEGAEGIGVASNEGKEDMTQNTLMDLNNHLFAELERLGDEELSDEELDREIRRAHAIQGTAQQVISNANVMITAAKLQDELYDSNAKVPRMLTGGGDKE